MDNGSIPDWKVIRAMFPILERCTYLNAAESGPVPQVVAEAGKSYYEESLLSADMNWDAWALRMESAREEVARYLNADKEEIAFTLSASHGMNLVADMLAGEGSVLTMEEEFPSSTIPWLHRNVPLHFVPSTEGRYPMGSIREAIRPGMKTLVSSHVQYKTGFRQDIDALGALCAEHGLTFVLNATQSMGTMPIDVKKARVDFLVFNSLKWVLAGYGIGVLYVSRKWMDKAKAPMAGWMSVKDPFAMDNRVHDLRSDASVLEPGCPHVPNIFALGAAMTLLNGIGPNRIRERIMTLNDHLEKGLGELGLRIISPLEPEHRSGITMVSMADPQKMVDVLRRLDVVVSRRGEAVRISVHFFNTEEDINKLLQALRDLI